MGKKLSLLLLSLFLCAEAAFAQGITVRGTVSDTKTGEGIPFASVMVQGTMNGTSTDGDGNYTITAPSDGVLVFTSIGYKGLAQPVGGQTVHHVALEPDSESLQETIVVAFGTTTKEAFTGSATVVKADELQKRVTTNVANALVGSVAGLQMRSASGAPGAGSGSINIRGIASMYAGTDPLIIVDGAPYTASLSNIPQSDIESVSVLKDAASAALYGARGAAGVILITTKRSRSLDAVVNVDMKWGVNSRAIQDYDVIKSPAAYYEAYYAQLYNYGVNGLGYSPEQANLYANNQMISDVGYNVYTVPVGQNLIGTNGKLNPQATLGRRYTYRGTEYYLTPDDWTDMAYSNAFRQEYNVSMNGGTDRATFYASIGYLNEDGIIEYSGYERISARVRADYQVKNWMKVGANVGFVHSNQESNPNMDTSFGSTNLMYYTSMIAPIYPVFIRIIDENGNVVIKKDERGQDAYDYGVAATNYGLNRGFLQTGNPLGSNRYNKVTTQGNQFTGTINADMDFFPFLKGNITSNVNWGQSNGSNYQNPFYGPKVGVNGELTKSVNTGLRTNHTQTLTYYQSFGDHKVNVIAGHEYYLTTTRYLSAVANGGFSPGVLELNGFSNKYDSSSYTSKYNVEGFFGSAQYNYDDRVFASASYRRDASSNFAKAHRWGNFWSIGGAWLIDRENFFDAAWVDMLKLKASYGQQGNDGIGAFRYVDQYLLTSSSETTMSPSFYRLGNPDITWETTNNFNTGVEFSLWRSRLSGSVDWYNKKTSDLLFYLSIPESNGVTGYYGNVGDIRNSGIEVVLTGIPVRTRMVDWEINLNFSHNRTKILSLPESKIAENGGFTESSLWYEVGGPLYNSFRAKFAGLNEEGEALYWVDEELEGSTARPGKNYSSTTTQFNNASRYALGSLLPKLFGGFSTSLRVLDFDMTATFDYQIGGKVYDSRYASLMSPSSDGAGGSNFHVDYIKSWTAENPTDIPRWQYNDKYTTAASDRFLTNASYLNFPSFTIGYNVRKSWIRKTGINKLRIYAAGENLYFWSARKGLDPRYSYTGNTSVSVYSPVRNLSLGAQITF